MTEKTMTTTTDVPQTYLISNSHHSHQSTDPYGDVYDWTWILFVEMPATESRTDHPHIEVYKYIKSASATQTKRKVVNVDEARAEWRFWIGQGFQRITNPTDKGWKYTGDIRDRAGIYKLEKSVKSSRPWPTSVFLRQEYLSWSESVKSEFCKKIVAELRDTNESEAA